VLLASAVALVGSPRGAGARGASEPAGGLPPQACVETVREARIARARGDTEAARQRLEAALDLPRCELPALGDLMRLLREVPGAAERAGALRERLAARLADPASELPAGLLSQLSGLGLADRERDFDRLLLTSIERRMASHDGAGRSTLRPELVELLTVRSGLEERLGLLDEARATLARLLQVAPTDAARWRALLHDMARQRWPEALEQLEALRAQPDPPSILRYHTVGVLARLGRYDEMLRELEPLAPPVASGSAEVPAGLLLQPSGEVGGFVHLLIEAAWSLRDAGRDAEAAALFRRALAYDPEHSEAQAALLHLYGSEEERAAAAAAVADRRRDETDPAKLFEEGTDLLGAGDYPGALALLERAAPGLAGSGYAEPAWYNLGNAAVKLERWDDAARAFEQALAVNPERADSHFKRGVALHHLERCREAVPALRRALELAPDKRDAHYYLGACHSKLGDAAAAAREMALFNAPR
jgi:tetratricopeptide (TPR) repeat protein